MRKQRKKEHVENYFKSTYEGDNLLGDIFLHHNSLPDLNFEDISSKTNFLGREIDYPIIINAMTGGAEFASEINRDLARLACEYNSPMAVGSQTIALCESDDCECINSFKIARDNMKDGIIIANLSGSASVDEVKAALEIVSGDAIQLHLNPAQEIVMLEGERDFTGVLSNIEKIVKSIDKPVIVKEVGFGISREVAKRLYEVGVENIDISGFGGTNFIEIEDIRYNNMDFTELYSWGIPTALAILEAREVSEDLKIIASGGIKNSLDIVKALVLGGDVVGISGELLSFLVHGGYDGAKSYLEALTYKLKVIMLLMGKENIEELKKSDYKITGRFNIKKPRFHFEISVFYWPLFFLGFKKSESS